MSNKKPIPKDQSVWDIYPVGLVLPWYSEKEELPPNMVGKWIFFKIANEGELFLRGSIKVAAGKGDLDGNESHAHHVVAHNPGEGDGRGFATEGKHVTFGSTEDAKHIPPCIKVRYLIRI